MFHVERFDFKADSFERSTWNVLLGEIFFSNF